MKKILLACFFAIVFSAACAVVSFAEPVTIAVAPFAVNSESGLDFLKTGIIDLFSSRLAFGNESIIIIDKVKIIDIFKDVENIDEHTALGKAKKLNIDYILFGNIKESPKGTSIESFLVNLKPEVNAKNRILVFSEKSSEYESADVLLLLVNRISTNIKRDVFKLNIPEENQKKPVNNDSRDVYAHPNTLIKGL